jgi:flagellar hook assembly protein FlgD/outer membrane protein OmpA-like peptidoglycan-associated protein
MTPTNYYRSLFLFAFFLFVFITPFGFAQYSPPPGGEDLFDFFSPLSVGTGATVTSGESPSADALNPAASAPNQRVTLDVSYAALAGLGVGASGLRGHVVNLGGVVPTRAGVLASTLHFLTSDYDTVELGSTFAWNLSFAKVLFPNLYIGLGTNLYLGGTNGNFDAGVTADLGILHAPARSYGLQNLRVALVLQELGKWYQPVAGRSGLPSPFTPRAGIAFDPVSTEDLSISVYGDLALPTFRNMRFSAGGIVTFQEVFSMYGGFRADLRQLLQSDIPARSLIPSFGISVDLKTDFREDDSFISRQGWNQSEVKTRAAAAPLYNGVWAIASGANIPLGVIDRRPPQIEVGYEETVFISPNNDGTQDSLLLPISISDERYLRGYAFRITDSTGATIREIQNKEQRPETEGFQNVLDRLFAVETGIPVPDEIRWDGTGASGGPVPDGTYTFSVEAWDDNGNRSEVGPFEIYVDNTPPKITLEPISRDRRVFSPNQDGQKDEITIVQRGSREETWTAWIENAAGKQVYTTSWQESTPDTLVWEGRDNNGEVLADGVYSYTIAATDRAGNAAQAAVENIIINNQATPIRLTIDSSYFSPNGDERSDTLTFFPDVPVRTGIVSWELDIVDSNGNVVQTLSDSSPPPAKISFTGRDPSGSRISEGSFTGRLSVRYENGNAPEAESPVFTVDLTPPSAVVQVDSNVFSPNGDGNLDTVTFFQETSTEAQWTGRLTDRRGEVVRTYSWFRQAEPRHVWSGRDASGRLVEDGEYLYTVEAVDRAGNRFSSSPVVVRKDTSDTEVVLTAEYEVFSPNSDGTKDEVRIFPDAQEDARIARYQVDIINSGGRRVRTYESRARLPESIPWDGTDSSGRRVPDGTYRATLTAVFENGNEEKARSGSIIVDTEYPRITAEATYDLFSPDGDGRRDVLPITQSSSSENLWEGTIRNVDGSTVRSYYWKGVARSFQWDGTDEAGNAVKDGPYVYEVAATDAAGNTTSERIGGLVVDVRQTTVFVTANRSAFSPNGDDVLDTVEVEAYVNLVDGAERWELEILSEADRVVRRFEGTDVEPSRTIEWDGSNSAGRFVDGRYTARFTVEYTKGNRPIETSGVFVLDTTPPEVDLSLSPVPFSPDNDGVEDELTIDMDVTDRSDIKAWQFEILDRNDRFFHQFSGRGMPARRLIWDGRSSSGELVISAETYPFRFTISDDVGNIARESGSIPVDILVVREGDRLKVRIADITFQPNSPRLVTDPSTRQGAKNKAILMRLAEVFDRYRNYSIRIEGHAVNVTGTEREEREELQPLSLARAQEVKEALVELGMNPRRISVLGRGGTDPIVPHEDKENRWKNRRVEFILLK